MAHLFDKKCVNYEPGSPPLTSEQQLHLGKEIPDWKNIEGKRIQREYKFKTYMDGISWTQEVGRISEAEDHHPDIRVLYRKVILELWTHTVSGLSDNDYILASKFDQSYEAFPGKR